MIDGDDENKTTLTTAGSSQKSTKTNSNSSAKIDTDTTVKRITMIMMSGDWWERNKKEEIKKDPIMETVKILVWYKCKGGILGLVVQVASKNAK